MGHARSIRPVFDYRITGVEAEIKKNKQNKENSFTKGFSINCLKEKYVYKITKDFPLTSVAGSHNSEQ